MASVQHGEGITDSERYLQRLAKSSFLSLWCYGGVFHDQGRHYGKGDGKEVADLLVVFGDDILIFSDKFCQYGTTQDELIDWKRWYRKAILKSARQLWGAERIVLTQPDKLYRDRACTIPFPLALPEPSRARIHKIAVAHGAAHRCRAYFGSGSGSLAYNAPVVGDEAPFTIGVIEQGKGFVHVLDDTTLDIILNTLDTITDFVNYLIRKERFLTTGKDVRVAGEENLLAYYLLRTNVDGEHDFTEPGGAEHFDSFSGVGISQGWWEKFSQSSRCKAQIDANKVSYVWDQIIEKFTKQAASGPLYHATKPGIENLEAVLHFMAREPRYRRRILARSFLEVVARPHNPSRVQASYARLTRPTRQGDPCYVFFALQWPTSQSHDSYREFRRNLLHAHCLVAKLIIPEAEDIVGIATELWLAPGQYQSEDAMYLDARQWDDDLKATAEELQRQLGIWTNVTFSVRNTEYEYPSVQNPESAEP